MGLFRRKRHDKIEFENIGVKESLIEMKDLSEQIIDLSYSALLFDSNDMARQVIELEERLDKLLYNVRIGVLLAARNREDAEQLSGILQVASAAEAMGDASLQLMRIFDEEINDSINAVLLDIVLMSVYNVLFFLGAFMWFLRYDVR